MMITNDNKDETLIYWTVCVINIIILKVIFGLGKLASASASWFWPRPRQFVLGLSLENLSSFNITGYRCCRSGFRAQNLINTHVYDNNEIMADLFLTRTNTNANTYTRTVTGTN